MSEKLHQAVAQIHEANRRFLEREISSIQHRDLREAAIVEGLLALADSFGVTLRLPLHVDSNGEINLTVMPADGRNPDWYGCGVFGAQLVELLNAHNPRTGTVPNPISEDNGWCRMNHFDVEKLLVEYDASLHATQVLSRAARPRP